MFQSECGRKSPQLRPPTAAFAAQIRNLRDAAVVFPSRRPYVSYGTVTVLAAQGVTRMQAKFLLSRPALGLIACFAAAPAFAADAVQEEPPAAPMAEPPVNTWDGPYAGVTVGYGFNGTTTPITGDIDDNKGFVGGVFGGYNFQQNMIVYGIEGDIGYGNIKGDNGITETKSGFEGSIRGRLGLAVTDDVLLYATAGGAGENLEVRDPIGSD